jgi:hypothetical protein
MESVNLPSTSDDVDRTVSEYTFRKNDQRMHRAPEINDINTKQVTGRLLPSELRTVLQHHLLLDRDLK